ncbi:cohesin domain-containing protein [Anaerosporobacter sp.]|uniref:cohesin domain-containing protein n=1 Tax=Anaerosporobacter sp. TaxID=1872529 RepID=UPI00286F067E|nr:cohesin domain-containing protein [Anaerosporobacter sp.]
MKQRKKAVLRYLLLLCLFVNMIPSVGIKAASATVSMTLKETDIKLNDTFNVIVKVEATDDIGGFETFLTYDEKKLEFISGGSLVSGSDGILRISDMNPENIVKSRKYILQFKAIEQGNAQIETMDQAYVYTYEDSAEMSVSSNRLSISIGTDEKVSNNAKLYSLRISPGVLSPEFTAKTTKYTAEVESDVKELVISAMAQDGDAKVKTMGNTNLQSGPNEVNIIVTAPSGDQKTYTIVVTKKGDSANPNDNRQDERNDIPEEPKDDMPEEDNTDVKDDVLEADGYLVTEEDGITLRFSYGYEIVPLEDETMIPDGYEETTMKLQNITLTAYEPVGGAVSDWVLLYMKKGDGEAQFYRYDKLENTVQRYDTSDVQAAIKSANKVTKDEYAKKLENMKILAAVSCVITLIATLIIIRLLVKLRGVKDDEFF